MNLLVEAGQLVYGGLVAWWSFLIDLGQAVWDWGMHLAGEVWEAAVEVVEKVGEVLGEFVSWALDFIGAIIQSYVTPLLEPLIQPLRDAIGRFLSLLPSGEDPPGLGLDAPVAYLLLEIAPIVTLFAGVIVALSMATGILLMTMPIGAAVVVALTTALLWALLAAPIEDLITQGSSLATEFLGSIAGMTIAGISSLVGAVTDFLVASGTAINGAILVVDAVAGFVAKFAFMASWSSWAAGSPVAGLAVSAIGWALVAAALIADGFLVSSPNHVGATVSLVLAAYGMAFAGAGIVLSVTPFEGFISIASLTSNLLLAAFSFMGFASAVAHLSSV